MNHIYFLSGPCGCGKSTLADAFARHLVDREGRRQVYVVHGDDFHAGFVQTQERVGPLCPQFMYWPDILAFNWSCMLDVAGRALARGMDVIIDYVLEEELPRVRALASRHGAQLHYAVLTASEAVIRQRLENRGNPELIDRALFLRQKLESMRENQGHLLDTSAMTTEEEIAALCSRDFTVPPDSVIPADETQAERITRMEQTLDEAASALKALEDALARCRNLHGRIGALEAYYASPQWMRDHEDDEAGRLPPDLRRGVLSEDGIWNLLIDWARLSAAHDLSRTES